MDDSLHHIIRVAPGKEREVSHVNHEHVCYFPYRTVRRFNRRHRVWRQSEELMLPGYLFVQCDDPRPFLSKPCASVFGPLRNTDRSFATVSGEDVEALRLREAEWADEASEFNRKVSTARHSFVPGTKARADQILMNIKSLEGQQEVKASVTMFRREFDVKVNVSRLEAV